MGLLHRLSVTFQKQDTAEDYERVLASLALSIQSKQTRLSEIRLRERRATLLVTLYAIGAWLVYLAAWWTVLPRWQIWRPNSRDEVTLQSIIKAVPAVVGPILILFIRRIVQAWYTRKAEQEEKQLKSLLAEQRTKIDEIKKKTNYYTTKNLLDRYDEPANRKTAAPSTPNNNLRQRNVPGGSGSQAPGLLQTPQGTPNRPPALQVVPPGGPTRQQLLQHTVPQPMAPPRKQWYDKLADAILGDDEASGGAQHSRYALICENCFAHNGLVRDSEYDDMKYVCPKCNHFNPSPRMKRENPTPLPSAVASGFSPSLRSSRSQNNNWASSRSPLREEGSQSPPLTSLGVESPEARKYMDGPSPPPGLNTKASSASLRSDVSRGRRGVSEEENEEADTSMEASEAGNDSMTRMDVDAR